MKKILVLILVLFSFASWGQGVGQGFTPNVSGGGGGISEAQLSDSIDLVKQSIPIGYVFSNLPPELGETWIDTTPGQFNVWEVKIWDGIEWEVIGYYDDTNDMYCSEKPIVILVLGQSNSMNGQSGGTTVTDKRITFYNVNTDRWEIADLRADIYSSTKVNYPGTDLVFENLVNTAAFPIDFARRLADETGRNVRIVPSQHGETAIEEWTESGNRPKWDLLVSQMAENGIDKFDGIIFHQGESNSQVTTGNFDSTTFADNLVLLRSNLIAENWYDGKSPFILGGIAITRGPEVNKALRGFAEAYEWVGYADGANLTTMPDGTHFTGNSKNVQGRVLYWNAWNSVPHNIGTLNEVSSSEGQNSTQDLADVLLQGNDANDRDIRNVNSLAINRTSASKPLHVYCYT